MVLGAGLAANRVNWIRQSDWLSLIPTMARIDSAYVYSLLLTLGSIITNLVVSAIFARYFETTSFLEFNILSRYFAFFIAIGSASVGYSIIYYLHQNIDAESLYANSVFINFCLVLVLVALAASLGDRVKLFSGGTRDWFVIACIWVLAQSFFHTVISMYRALQRYREANQLSLFVKIMLLLAVAIYCALSGKSIFVYYGLIGIGSILVLMIYVKRLEFRILPSVDLSIVKKILSFSASRWGDNMLRLGFPVLLIMIISLKGNVEVAGYIAILLIPLKAIESAVQPLVMIVFSKWVGKRANVSKEHLMLVLGLSLTVAVCAVIFTVFFGEWFVAIWITERYTFLVEHLVILTYSIFPLISIALFRGMMEGEFKHSPSFFVNLLVLLLPIAFIWVPITLQLVVWAIVISAYLRFIVLGSIYLNKLEQ